MEDPMIILANLNTIQERYGRLKNLFNEFCAQVLNLKNEDERLNILAIEQSDNILSIEFLDRKIVAEFSFLVDDNGGQKGYISCQLMSPTEDGNSKLIEKFSFNGQGNASLATSNEDDPYVINDRTDAISIVLNWAAISVKENF